MDNRFNNIDAEIQEVKGDIKEMKDTMNQMELNSRISMILTGLNKGLLINEYEVRKKQENILMECLKVYTKIFQLIKKRNLI